MKIYVYGIIDSNNKIGSSIKGLKGGCVYNVPYQDIGVVVSDINGQMKDITKDHALEHEEVVEKLMEKNTVLPVSFLTVFDKKQNVLSMMEDYYSDFRENLNRLRNKVEFGIKVIWQGDKIKERIIAAYAKNNPRMSVSDDSPAKGFIKEKFKDYKIDREFEKEADKWIGFVDDVLSRFAAKKKLGKPKSEKLLLNSSYLVEKEKQDDFKVAFERLRKSTAGLKYLFSGPWPPYNFVVLSRKPHSLSSRI